MCPPAVPTSSLTTNRPSFPTILFLKLLQRPFLRRFTTVTNTHASTSGTMTRSIPPLPPPALTTPDSSTTPFTTTTILPVDPSSIHFTPSPSLPPSMHPFHSPALHITDTTTLANLTRASTLLSHTSHPIAFPTETVYGLGANALSSPSVQSIFTAKSRPQDNPLIVHISSLTQLRTLLPPGHDIPDIYIPLINRFWPGPLTILLPLPPHSPLAKEVTAEQATFAVRMPKHPIALALAHMSGLPIAAPSANKSGCPSPTTAAHVWKDMQGRIELILDGGQAEVGVESTVVSGLCDPPRVLRPGGVTVEMLREGLRRVTGGGKGQQTEVNGAQIDLGKSGLIGVNGEEVPLVPGMKYRHYSPKAKVVLYEQNTPPPTVEKLLASLHCTSNSISSSSSIGIIRTRTWAPNWSTAGTAVGAKYTIEEVYLGTSGAEISRGLFAALRELDERGVAVIHVEGIAEENEGLAVMNRLRKAAGEIVRP
ncbi:DHBP synthase RibB-like alpha/beta domain-containing protein [Terfezia claveryi]|nr:DHBP synthase RibB-like alpha/beta domain-containing protein [Terfezia claveryi]